MAGFTQCRATRWHRGHAPVPVPSPQNVPSPLTRPPFLSHRGHFPAWNGMVEVGLAGAGRWVQLGGHVHPFFVVFQLGAPNGAGMSPSLLPRAGTAALGTLPGVGDRDKATTASASPSSGALGSHGTRASWSGDHKTFPEELLTPSTSLLPLG